MNKFIYIISDLRIGRFMAPYFLFYLGPVRVVTHSGKMYIGGKVNQTMEEVADIINKIESRFV